MTQFRLNASSRRRPTTTAFAVAVAAVVAALLSGQAASAAPNPPDVSHLISCPPPILKVAQPVSSAVYDAVSGHYDTTVAAGALPDGLSIIDDPKMFHLVSGTPTKVGSFSFTLRIASFVGNVGTKACVVDIVPADSIIDRISGPDRYAVSVEIAKQLVPTGTTPLVYLASGETFADALSASAIAAQHHAPLLLTTSGSLPTSVSSVISRMKPADVVVVGGPATIGQVVVDQLEAIAGVGAVTRIGGADRFAVSRALIQDTAFGAKSASTVYLASGRVFPDALSASPAAAKIAAPVLLLDGLATTLTADEKDLLTSRGTTAATVLGGSFTVTSALESDIKSVVANTSRVGGVDRFAVSAAVNAAAFPTTETGGAVYFATGSSFPDALAGGVLAGVGSAPLFLVSKSCVDAQIAAQVRAHHPTRIVLLGGPNSLDTALEKLPVCS